MGLSRWGCEHVDVPPHDLPTEVWPHPDDHPRRFYPFQPVPRRIHDCDGRGRIPPRRDDTKEDATRLAVEAAKRHMLEQVVTSGERDDGECFGLNA